MRYYRVWWSDGNDRQELTGVLFKDLEGALQALDLDDAIAEAKALYIKEEFQDEVEDTGMGDDRLAELMITHCPPPENNIHCPNEDEEECEHCEGNYEILTVEEVDPDE